MGINASFKANDDLPPSHLTCFLYQEEEAAVPKKGKKAAAGKGKGIKKGPGKAKGKGKGKKGYEKDAKGKGKAKVPPFFHYNMCPLLVSAVRGVAPDAHAHHTRCLLFKLKPYHNVDVR